MFARYCLWCMRDGRGWQMLPRSHLPNWLKHTLCNTADVHPQLLTWPLLLRINDIFIMLQKHCERMYQRKSRIINITCIGILPWYERKLWNVGCVCWVHGKGSRFDAFWVRYHMVSRFKRGGGGMMTMMMTTVWYFDDDNQTNTTINHQKRQHERYYHLYYEDTQHYIMTTIL
jgi:hypothetical protein